MIGTSKVTIRPATPADKRAVFEWCCLSDITAGMMGEPLFPDNPVPTWEEFQDDYLDHFFDGTKPRLGRSFIIQVAGEDVGHINYNNIEDDNSTELDTWLKNSHFTGKGYGTAAIQLLCDYLKETFDCPYVIIAPSRRNPYAIKSYLKAGFVEADFTPKTFVPDYFDAIVLVKWLG
jgi:RimJ/RimL family protein N-acetyltransferase